MFKSPVPPFDLPPSQRLTFGRVNADNLNQIRQLLVSQNTPYHHYHYTAANIDGMLADDGRDWIAYYNNQAIGILHLYFMLSPNKVIVPFVGYMVDEEQKGKGFATEILSHFVKTYKNENLPPLHASVSLSNKASLRVLQKSGFYFIGIGSETSLDRGGLIFSLQQSLHNITRISQRKSEGYYPLSGFEFIEVGVMQKNLLDKKIWATNGALRLCDVIFNEFERPANMYGSKRYYEDIDWIFEVKLAEYVTEQIISMYLIKQNGKNLGYLFTSPQPFVHNQYPEKTFFIPVIMGRAKREFLINLIFTFFGEKIILPDFTIILPDGEIYYTANEVTWGNYP